MQFRFGGLGEVSAQILAEERAHYQGLVESYQRLIDGILISMANGSRSITARQAKDILRTLRRARKMAERGVELYTDE